MANFCSSCGTQSAPGGAFCAKCGARFGDSAGSAVASAEPVVPAAAPPAGARAQTSWAWWLLPLFFTWLGGLIGFFCVGRRNKGKALGLLIFGIVWAVILGVIIILPLF